MGFKALAAMQARQRAGVMAGALGVVVALAAGVAEVSGGATASARASPNVDVYLMLDTSPSMEIAGTSAGMASLVAATRPNLSGCAFGCHQSNPSNMGTFSAADGGQLSCATSGAYADGTSFSAGAKFPSTGRDSYDLSRCLGVALRIDLVRDAVRSLVKTAAQTEKSDDATYRIALFETDTNQPNPANDLDLYTLQPLTGDLSPGGAADTAAATIAGLEVYQNNWRAKDLFDFDMETFLDSGISSLNQLMPAPGSGAHNAGDTPQEVLFIVTDGLNDQTPRRTYSPMDWSGVNCTAVKNRGVRIAVLYTTYVPMNDDPWYSRMVSPALPKGLPQGLPPSTPVGADPMALAAQQCASPSLYEQVGLDGDIPSAMQTLFRRAVQATQRAG
jgi:hypothetical protein